MRGQGPAAKPALLRVDGAGKITTINTDTLTYTSVTLPNPANETQPQNGRGANQRMQSITQLRYADGKVWISGLSNEEFASKMWSVAYPFAKADSGTSLEIYHDNHQQLETRAPMYAFIPYILNNQPYIIGAYTCTPLVKFPVASLKSGDKVRGTTIGEFGAGNQPLDMFLYKKDGKDYILMSNSAHGVLKIATAPFGAATPITERVGGTAGVPFERISSMAGVQQMDLLDAQRGIVIAKAADGAINLTAVVLP
jgi:hypothetical protein